MTGKASSATTALTDKQIEMVMEAIKTRCVEEGDCLLWTGGYSRSSQKGSRQRTPMLWMGDGVRSLRRAAYLAYNGSIREGFRAACSCGNDLCLARDHLVQRSYRQSMVGVRRSHTTVAKIERSKQALGKLDWEKVDDIRASDQSHSELAAKYGVHKSTIEAVRAHKSWRTTGMFTQLLWKSA